MKIPDFGSVDGNLPTLFCYTIYCNILQIRYNNICTVQKTRLRRLSIWRTLEISMYICIMIFQEKSYGAEGPRCLSGQVIGCLGLLTRTCLRFR